MGDRDDRGNRDSRADRYGGGGDRYYNSNSGHEQREYNTSGGDGGGRYNRARFRNDSDGSYGGGYRPNQRPRHDMSGGYGGGWDTAQQQQQFDPFLMQQNLSGGQDGYNMPFNMNYPPGGNSHHHNSNGGAGGVDPALLSMLQAQAPFPGGQGGDININNNMPFGAPMPGGYNMGGNAAGGGAAMDPADLLQLLLTQQQQQQPSLHGDYAGSMSNAHVDHSQEARVPQSAPAATRTLPSVEEFVPVVPKSLLSLIRGNDGSAGYSGSGGQTSGSPQPQQQQQASSSFGGSGGNNNNNAGAMVLLEAPKIAPEADRRAREQRRAHVTGFPNGTTREELEEYFRLLLPEVRRLRTEREIQLLAEETGLLKDEGEDALRHIPADANLANIDTVKDINVSQGKVKDFSFVEFRLGDIVEELVDQCTADPQRFLFTSAMDGRSYPLVIRRPRDTVPLTGIDTSKVVLIGFPLSMPADTIKSVFDSFGKLVTFEVKNGYAFGEFEELRDATDFRADVHGLVLGNSVVVALPLYDWLKVLLVREGFDIEIADDDPLSGKYVMQQVRDRAPELLSGGGGAGGGGGGLAGGADGAKSTALVLADDPEAASLQLMRELLDMSYTLPDMLARFSGLYPHLRPLYGNAQVSVFPTPILVLLNMFDEEELVYDNTYSQLLADIEEEVEKYGRVRQLIVPRREARPKLPEAPKPGVDYEEENEESREAAMAAYNEAKRNFGAVLGRYMSRQTHPVWGGYGRVFVEYETVDEAAEAQQGIAGKLFGERTVVTSFLFPDLLKEDDDDDDDKEEAKEEAASVDADALSEKGSDNQQQEEGEGEDGKEEKEEEGDENVDEGEGAVGNSEEDIDAEKSVVSAHAEDID